jgi:hypothetical protein
MYRHKLTVFLTIEQKIPTNLRRVFFSLSVIKLVNELNLG